jgi:hypothetical protein
MEQLNVDNLHVGLVRLEKLIKTRKAINYKWMQEESRGVDYVIINNF